VDCILPFFDRATAGNVVKYLTGQLSEMPGSAGKKVLLDGRALMPNPAISEAVWEAWDALPTETLPQRGARPIKRLVTLAQALSLDGLRPGALKEVETEMHAVLDAYATRYAKQLDEAVKEVWDVEVQEIAGRVGKAGVTYREFVERADDRAIRSGFEVAKKAFGADIAQSYVNHVAGTDDDDDLRDAYVKAAALAVVKEAREKVDRDAIELTTKWFDEHRVGIKSLVDDRQAAYEEIRAMAVDPQRSFLSRPRTRLEDYAVVDDNGQVEVAALAPLHLMSDENGEFPLSSLNEWEREVVSAELARPDVRGWYRNPSRQAVDSLGIAYNDKAGWRSMHPDFVFFHEVQGAIRASIVDPHGHHLDDAKIKLQALAAFANAYGQAFHRIEAVSQVNGVLRAIDMQISENRNAILRGDAPPIELYKPPIGVEYVVDVRGGH
jgi:hypothetical protein